MANVGGHASRRWLTAGGLLVAAFNLPPVHCAAWQPLVGDSTDAILTVHRNPLSALRQGKIPAIVVRAALSPSRARHIVSLLGGSPSWDVRSPVYETLGVDLHTYVNRRGKHSAGRLESAYANASARASSDFAASGYIAATLALSSTLRGLHAAPVDFASHGIFRKQKAGSAFKPHSDTLHSAEWRRACRDRERQPLYKPVTGRAARVGPFSKMRAFEHQFSALLALQMGTDLLQDTHANGELQLFDTDWRELRSGCLASARPYAVGVEFANWQSDLRRVTHVRQHSLNLTVGDVYIFNSNRVHLVRSVSAGLPRIVLGSFVGYSADGLLVWS
ncbi:hypothetical protein T492DRAFT_1087817 [Pavlovales sp. CCMP2436]|nr:hypothetical protein T492DRAFT_1087817 [Pavlovales sp. CCMP2436]|mmetsp:Transcript_29325/g.73623  ORF Transcript_29325/g.73623 Transcript_29325/m.73623 type:complete len:333 (-) Transcript_29325:59-1057(-)